MSKIKFHTREVTFSQTQSDKIKITSFALDEPIYVDKIKLKFKNYNTIITKGSGHIFTEGFDILSCKVDEKEEFGNNIKELVCVEGG